MAGRRNPRPPTAPRPALPSLAAVLVLAAVLALAAGCERFGGKESPSAGSDGAAAGNRPAASGEEIARADPPVILILGDSLSAGFGVEEADGYPARLQTRLRAAGYPHRVVNAGVSGDTSAGGLARLDWLLRQRVAILIVELGANDALRGQEPAQTRANLARIIEKGRAAGARVVLAGMRIPVNFGWDYKRRFDAIYPELAERYDVPLIPFILDGVAGRRDLNLPDGMHPNGAGYRIVADTVWEALEPLLDGY